MTRLIKADSAKLKTDLTNLKNKLTEINNIIAGIEDGLGESVAYDDYQDFTSQITVIKNNSDASNDVIDNLINKL